MDASKVQKQAGAEENTSFLGRLQMELRVKAETEEEAAWEPKETSAAHPGHRGRVPPPPQELRGPGSARVRQGRWAPSDGMGVTAMEPVGSCPSSMSPASRSVSPLLFPCLSITICLSLSLPFSVFPSLPLRLSVSVSPSLCTSLSLSLFVRLSISVSLSLPLSVSLPLSPSLRLCLSLCLYVSVSLLLSVSLCLCLCLSLSLPVSVPLWCSHSLSFSLSLSLSLSVSASLSLCLILRIKRQMCPRFKAHWEKQSRCGGLCQESQQENGWLQVRPPPSTQAHKTVSKFIFLRTGPVDFL